jgi:F-type H+-transporting ATPase subunit b
MMLTLVALVQEGAEHAGPASPFEVNPGLMFWTLIVFAGLFFTLKRFAWPAILKATEERERTIAKQLEGADKANREAQALLEENKRLLAESRAQAQSILAEAKMANEKERAAALEKTRLEQEELLARARRDIASEKDKALIELRREAVDLSLAAATKLMGARLDSEADRKLVSDYLATLERN